MAESGIRARRKVALVAVDMGYGHLRAARVLRDAVALLTATGRGAADASPYRGDHVHPAAVRCTRSVAGDVRHPHARGACSPWVRPRHPRLSAPGGRDAGDDVLRAGRDRGLPRLSPHGLRGDRLRHQPGLGLAMARALHRALLRALRARATPFAGVRCEAGVRPPDRLPAAAGAGGRGGPRHAARQPRGAPRAARPPRRLPGAAARKGGRLC